jgi:hypothetical protein
VAGLVVGLLATVAVARGAGPEHDDAVGPRPPGDAAGAFLEAWARSRTATYAAEGVFTRSFDGEPALSADVRIAQRPPDRLEVRPGSATGRSGGRRLACAVEDDGELSCRTGDPVGPYGDAVEREVDLLREQVVGPDRVYEVSDDGDCFTLVLVRRDASAQYGSRAQFCFDADTGALASSRVERGPAVDEVRMGEIRTEVRDEDLGTGQG